MSIPRRFKVYIQSLVSVALIFGVYSLIDWEFFLPVLNQSNVYFISAGALLFFPALIVSALRWGVALRNYNLSIPFAYSVRLYLEGTFISNFLPTSFGGDIYKFYRLNQIFRDRKLDIINSMLIERGAGFVALLVVNAVTVIFYFDYVTSNNIIFLLQTLLLALFIIMLLVTMFRKYIFLSLKRVTGFSKISARLVYYFESFVVRENYLMYTKTLGLSIVFVLLIGLGQVCYLLAFNESLPFGLVLVIVSMTYASAVLPISLNSIGVIEGMLVFLYVQAGVDLNAAIAVALSGRVCQLVCSLVGVFTLWYSPLSMKELFHSPKE